MSGAFPKHTDFLHDKQCLCKCTLNTRKYCKIMFLFFLAVSFKSLRKCPSPCCQLYARSTLAKNSKCYLLLWTSNISWITRTKEEQTNKQQWEQAHLQYLQPCGADQTTMLVLAAVTGRCHEGEETHWTSYFIVAMPSRTDVLPGHEGLWVCLNIPLSVSLPRVQP